MTKFENADGWQLRTLSIRLQDWGEFAGQYMGTIEFVNRKKDAFVFTIPPDRVEDYLRLLKSEIASSAEHLGNKLIQSLNLIPERKIAEIPEAITA